MLLMPLGARAQTFADLVGTFTSILNSFIPLIFGITFLVIVYGVIQAWVVNGGDPEKIKSGRNIALAGVIGLVVMSSVWGIVALLRDGLFG